MTYQIRIKPSAVREIRRLPKAERARLKDAIYALADNPIPQNSKALKGRFSGYRRIRVGNYRAIYRIEANVLLLLVLRVRHRRDVYRRPPAAGD